VAVKWWQQPFSPT